ncbi:F-box protein At5g65850 isoform X1 [Raphanus sativus]|uniref:F-box protein At5g65850 isoform X1 n=1 Tax=Raphanus sativus TaxID=3726 RepID=A0A9W3DR22_RAPSA|nr:F-box protein At5g65850 isoform X1 [Raphanus sativus]XP_056866078.1 F-box protein At5g65850 isoform X1 [Raphanus sativus]
MKPRRQNVSGRTIYRRFTRSMTRLHQNSLPVPDELVYEILSRLPSKAIARCRCVCNLWSSVLRRQDFTDSFLTKSSAHPQLLFVFEGYSEIHFFSSPQPENPEENSYVVASNHLACFPSPFSLFLCTSGFSCYGQNLILNCKAKMVICNPSTGQSFTLPKLTFKRKTNYVLYTYYGYDLIEKNFKVLSMACWPASNGLTSVEHQVLTLGAKRLSWRMVECCIPHLPSCGSKWICISGVLYYLAAANSWSLESMVVCFDFRTEKFTLINCMETFNRALPDSTNMVNYNGKLGLLMSGDSHDVTPASTSFELWVLLDAAKHEWSKHVYVLPPSWEDVVAETMCITGMVGTNEIVFSPLYQRVPSYVIYFNVERKTITKVGILGMEAFQGKIFNTYLNFVENVKLL